MTTPTQKNRATLLMIAGIPVTIILAASWLWYFVASGRIDLIGVLGTANRGALLSPPYAIEALELVDDSGRAFTVSEDQPLWRIMILGTPGCGADCQHTVYYTRQIHTAMGKYTNRIERVFVVSDASPGEDAYQSLTEDYPELKVLYTSAPNVAAMRRAVEGDETPAYFVVDPAGWTILSYTADADGKDIMADLKFLLKNSNG